MGAKDLAIVVSYSGTTREASRECAWIAKANGAKVVSIVAAMIQETHQSDRLAISRKQSS